MYDTPAVGTPYPIGELLPAVLQDDDLAMRLTAGLDRVIAPAIAALDCLDAYLDPRLAPEDFLHWLAGWVGAAVDESWPVERRRAAVSQAVSLHNARGTVAGLRAHLEMLTGTRVEIVESGGVTWSQSPDTDVDIVPANLVVLVDADSTVRHGELDEIVAAAKPAGVTHRVELRG
nr:phage tail protein I [Kibdelosporangium sp. MJ126-NF4]CEL12806.1 NHL repeat domain protein [Kibdelosporangium sp. MJ126-NF4]CTQ98492.1 NHL repeat domain protein [Kibdelosporangium sp. MJ126-NF4]